jgi:hypothetical protein
MGIKQHGVGVEEQHEGEIEPGAEAHHRAGFGVGHEVPIEAGALGQTLEAVRALAGEREEKGPATIFYPTPATRHATPAIHSLRSSSA